MVTRAAPYQPVLSRPPPGNWEPRGPAGLGTRQPQGPDLGTGGIGDAGAAAKPSLEGALGAAARESRLPPLPPCRPSPPPRRTRPGPGERVSASPGTGRGPRRSRSAAGPRRRLLPPARPPAMHSSGFSDSRSAGRAPASPR